MTRKFNYILLLMAISAAGSMTQAQQPVVSQPAEMSTQSELSAQSEVPMQMYAPAATSTDYGSFVFEAEAMFLKYLRADGVRGGDDEPTVPGSTGDARAEFDFEAAPRITLGYATPSGLGVRLRWFDYDHQAQGFAFGGIESNTFIAVDTTVIDLEVFDSIQLNQDWALEVAAGFRYTNFTETQNETVIGLPQQRINAIDAAGGLLSMGMRRQIGNNVALFARTRGSFLYGDKFIRSDDFAIAPVVLNYQVDNLVGMLEISAGGEFNRQLGNGVILFGSIAGEWQNWFNFSSSYEDTNTEGTFGGQSDVGFAGVTLSLGVRR